MESRKEQGKEDDLSYSQIEHLIMETIQVVNPRLYTSVMKKL